MRYLFSCFIIAMFALSSCGTDEINKLSSRVDSLQVQLKIWEKEAETLKSQLDDCKNGEERLTALVRKSFKEKNYYMTKRHINKLANEHPQAKVNIEFKLLLSKVEKI